MVMPEMVYTASGTYGVASVGSSKQVDPPRPQRSMNPTFVSHTTLPSNHNLTRASSPTSHDSTELPRPAARRRSRMPSQPQLANSRPARRQTCQIPTRRSPAHGATKG
ncbi:hypothetical protein PMIN07_011577 [Paraphaeosphaeria minitans]